MGTIKRAKRNTPFVQIDKRALQDKELSWKAKGMLAYLLSLPDDWEVYISELKYHSTDGRDSTRTAINELIDAGYVIRKQLKDKEGRFGKYEYTVFETKTSVGKPEVGKPEVGKPATTNKDSTNKDSTNNSLIGNSDFSELDDLPLEEKKVLRAKKELDGFFSEWPAMKEQAIGFISESGKELEQVMEEWARHRLKTPFVLENVKGHVSSDFLPWCRREGQFAESRKAGSKRKLSPKEPGRTVKNEYGTGGSIGIYDE